MHGSAMFVDKAKIYGELYIQSTFEETSSCWSVPKAPNVSVTNVPNVIFLLVTSRKSGFYWSAFHNHEGSTFTEKDRNKINYRIGPKRT